MGREEGTFWKLTERVFDVRNLFDFVSRFQTTGARHADSSRSWRSTPHSQTSIVFSINFLFFIRFIERPKRREIGHLRLLGVSKIKDIFSGGIEFLHLVYIRASAVRIMPSITKSWQQGKRESNLTVTVFSLIQTRRVHAVYLQKIFFIFFYFFVAASSNSRGACIYPLHFNSIKSCFWHTRSFVAEYKIIFLAYP